jgi:hypothetical protein
MWALTAAGLAAAVLMLAAPTKSQAQSFGFGISTGYRTGYNGGGLYGGFGTGGYLNSGYGSYGSGWNGGYVGGFCGTPRPPIVIVEPCYRPWNSGYGCHDHGPIAVPYSSYRVRPY